MDDALAAVRAVHFAATALAAGGILFQCLVADAALRTTSETTAVAQAYRRRLARIVAAGLALAVLSGIAWLLLLAANIGGQKLAAVLTDDTAWVLLTQTRFGSAWLARLAVAALLAGGLVLIARRPAASVRWGVAAGAALLIGSLAWSGHAGGTPAPAGDLHRLSDFLHLVAAGAWLGGLLPLALLLRLAETCDLGAAARVAARRFSALGLISVATLLATGLFNTWMLVGSLPAALETPYGQLLLAKVALFLAMVGLAAVNRLRWTPRLPDRRAVRALKRNALTETGLGLIIIGIVGVLGMLAPAAHSAMPMHMH